MNSLLDVPKIQFFFFPFLRTYAQYIDNSFIAILTTDRCYPVLFIIFIHRNTSLSLSLSRDMICCYNLLNVHKFSYIILYTTYIVLTNFTILIIWIKLHINIQFYITYFKNVI